MNTLFYFILKSVGTKQKDIALTMAPIIVLLWSQFPNFGKIFLAQLQEKCPYIVPYYPKKEDDEMTHLIACGYNVNKDGTIESEDSFLNRMRSIIKIYAAVIQSNVPNNHPHDINHGWKWIARVLNMEPRPGITPAILEAFLSITAHKFYRIYRFQFIKLVDLIASEYMNKIEKVSQKEVKKQSSVKLSLFINKIIKSMQRNNLKELIPDGLIPDYFWQSSYTHSRGISFGNNL